MTYASEPSPPPHLISDADQRRAAKRLERANAAKVLRVFAKLVAKMGFKRRSTFFYRESGEVIQFLHLHKYTFGPNFRMHICIRVLNDPTATCALSGTEERQLAQVNFEYGTDVASIQACAEVMARFVADFAEPWFASWSNEALLSDTSFLRPISRESLAAHIAGRPDKDNIRASRALF